VVLFHRLICENFKEAGRIVNAKEVYKKMKNVSGRRSGVHRLASGGCIGGDMRSNLQGSSCSCERREETLYRVTVYFESRLR